LNDKWEWHLFHNGSRFLITLIQLTTKINLKLSKLPSEIHTKWLAYWKIIMPKAWLSVNWPIIFNQSFGYKVKQEGFFKILKQDRIFLDSSLSNTWPEFWRIWIPKVWFFSTIISNHFCVQKVERFISIFYLGYLYYWAF